MSDPRKAGPESSLVRDPYTIQPGKDKINSRLVWANLDIQEEESTPQKTTLFGALRTLLNEFIKFNNS